VRVLFGGVETGGTWCVCALGSGPHDLIRVERFRTERPNATIDRIVAFFAGGDQPEAIGVGAFGPLDLDRGSPGWGSVTTTPKPGWGGVPLARRLQERLDLPVAIDTDVAASGIAEYRWGAGRGVRHLCYLTVGTGIGGALLADGRPHHGLIHPEPGHLRIPHDRGRDPFAGSCPRHGDCWEGLASGTAIAARWGHEGDELGPDHPGWELVAEYLAVGLASIVFVASPQRIVAGGGVLEQPGLLDRVRVRLRALVAGYLPTPLLEDEIERYLVAPELGDDAGVLGALALAERLHHGGD
jgi:fructokinase